MAHTPFLLLSLLLAGSGVAQASMSVQACKNGESTQAWTLSSSGQLQQGVGETLLRKKNGLARKKGLSTKLSACLWCMCLRFGACVAIVPTSMTGCISGKVRDSGADVSIQWWQGPDNVEPEFSRMQKL
jgi:hypothetical protein